MKILLCCNAGMSSSILVKKIRDVAEKTGEDIEVSAVANASIKNEVGKWDVCLEVHNWFLRLIQFINN